MCDLGIDVGGSDNESPIIPTVNYKRNKETLNVSVCMCVCVCGGVVRDCECVSEWDDVCVCVRERERVCVCVCVHVCKHQRFMVVCGLMCSDRRKLNIVA